LVNEGLEVFRPIEVRDVGHGIYEILPTVDYDPADEEWEFLPGSQVRIQMRQADEGDYYIAVEL